MIRISFLIIAVLVILSGTANCQVNTLSLKVYEDSLKSQFVRLIESNSDSERFEHNAIIDKLFSEALKNNESFNYPFDSLKNIAKLKSDDGLVRIINWDIPLENGTFVYLGYIQYRDKNKKLELFPLVDKSEEISRPESKELSNRKWYGALYYNILTNKSGKTTIYTVLGWDGNDNFTNKKIIDAFEISGSTIKFGPPVFKTEQGTKNRLIFEFGEQLKMMLRYDESIDMIVFDHLAPSQKKFEGQYIHYGPDMSQDGIKFEKGIWNYKPNLDLRNKSEIKGKPVERSNKIINH